MNILIIIITLNLVSVRSFENSSDAVIFSSDGDVKLAILIEDCELNQNVKLPYLRTIINSAIWVVNRLNTLDYTKPLTLGLEIINVCNKHNNYDAIFKIFQEHLTSHNYLGVITPHPSLPSMISKMADIISIPVKQSVKFLESIHVVTKVLVELEMFGNILVFAPNQLVLKEFYRVTRKEWICVNDFMVYNENTSFIGGDGVFNGTIVAFGNDLEISYLVKENKHNYPNATLILVPLDGKIINDIPDNSLIIEPPYSMFSDKIPEQPKLPPSPLLFEIASPILSFISDLPNIMKRQCKNETEIKTCLHNISLQRSSNFDKVLTPDVIVKLLKIETIAEEFVYNVFKVENLTFGGHIDVSNENLTNIANETSDFDDIKSTSTYQRYVKLFSYNIFSNKLMDHYELSKDATSSSTCLQKFDRCILECANFKSYSLLRSVFFPISPNGITLRPEPWVFAFLSLTLLGVLFCIAILIFLITKSCKNTTLEGNPLVTIILLLSVVLLFISVIPFCLQSVENKDLIHLSRFLSLSLPYTLTFSILLSRSIMLATISKDSGFMNHISGYVQFCLQLFIFGVQCAIVIQLSRKCNDFFNNTLLIFVLSYNSLLLLILICIAPLIIKSPRNYKEGKYFTISILLIAIIWCFWLPGYTYLDHNWKEPIICLGLFGTAGALLGGVFIPRTYLMTVSAARDRFTSVLPSLATVSSTLDIYRANTQPIYDCVNIAVLNAARAAAAAGGHPPPPPHFQHQSSIAQDYYGPSRIPDDEFEEVNLQVENCIPSSPDKITRF